MPRQKARNPRQEKSGNMIHPTPMPRVALDKSLQSQPSALPRPMLLYRLNSIIRTCRIKPTAMPQERADA
jgi:hypothetical protein